MDYKLAGLNLTEEEIAAIEASSSEIADISRFLEYFKTNKLLNKVQLHTGSDGKKYDLRTPKNVITANIMNLPEAEQEKILLKSETVRGLFTKVTNLKRAAFGEYKEQVSKADTLLVSKRAELMEYFGRMFNPKEVYQIIREEWKNTDISLSQVNEFYKTNYEAIKAAIDRHKEDYSEMRLTAKKSRLEELVSLYGRANRKYISSGKTEDGKFAKEIIAEIRKETEGDVINHNIKGDINMNIQQSVHVRTEMFKDLNIKEIILGRVAAKSGVSYGVLVESLNRSSYSKYNALINGGVNVDFGDDIKYPSQDNYDFGFIKQVHDRKEEQQLKTIDITPPEEKKSAPVDDTKRLLLEKLKNLTNKTIEQEIKTKKNTL